MRNTQQAAIIKLLKKRYVSTWDAFELLGCTKLGTRVSELIQSGKYEISKRDKKVTTRYGAKVIVKQYKILKEVKSDNIRTI
jgi:hypothetical protein